MGLFKKISMTCCLSIMAIGFCSLQFNAFAKPNEQKKLQIVNISDETKIKSRVLPEMFGGKAYGLSLLHEYGYKIPDTVFIEATDDLCTIENDDFKNSLHEAIQHLSVNGKYPVAVRSSCTNEDSFDDSKAGQFDTIMGDMSFDELIDNIKKVVTGLSKEKGAKGKMGIIVQRKINADYSGVVFSSSPLSFSKKEMIISFVEGLGDKLVSGKVKGTDVLVSVANGKYKIVNDKDILLHDSLLLLAQRSKKLEKELNYPIDIEWSVVGSELIFLQCRPLSSITKIKSGLHFVNSKNLSSIPKQLISHDKFDLRLAAQEKDALSSGAYIFIQNNCFEHTDSPIELKKSLYCTGHNAVMTYPKHLNGKVIKSFIGDKSNLAEYIPVCDEYVVNSYPKFKNVNECLNEYYRMTKDEYWITSTIIQEIFDPIYTGIIQKTSKGYILETTYGNFISKGVVPTSQYVIDNNRKVVSKKEILQNSWYQITEGHVLFCSYLNNNSVLVSLSEKNINCIIDLFEKLSNGSGMTLEFGMLKEEKSENMIPFLMDYVKNDLNTEISDTNIEEGIVSHGSVSGKIVHISDMNTNSIDTHFHDVIDKNQKSDEKIIFFCQKPDIALLKLLQKYSPDKIGFVFEDCSLLCHLAVLLREKGIPAIKIGKDFINNFEDGQSCVLDAVTPSLIGSARISCFNN